MSSNRILLQIHKDLVNGEIKLPTLPRICLKIKQAASNPNINLEKLGEIAQMDPAFCGYLLQVSNSAIYRGVREIKNVSLAIGRLGLQNTRNMAMTYAVRALFSFNDRQSTQWLQRVWRESTYTAAVAAVIADHVKLKFDRDEAILAGLLQDIGCLPLIDKATHYPELINDERAMLQLFDRYAAKVGAAIMRKWQLDEKFVTLLQNRNNWKYNAQNQVDITDLILIAKLHTYIGTTQLEPLPKMIRTPSFIKLHLEAQLSPQQSLQFVADAKQKISEMQKALNG